MGLATLPGEIRDHINENYFTRFERSPLRFHLQTQPELPGIFWTCKTWYYEQRPAFNASVRFQIPYDLSLLPESEYHPLESISRFCTRTAEWHDDFPGLHIILDNSKGTTLYSLGGIAELFTSPSYLRRRKRVRSQNKYVTEAEDREQAAFAAEKRRREAAGESLEEGWNVTQPRADGTIPNYTDGMPDYGLTITFECLQQMYLGMYLGSGVSYRNSERRWRERVSLEVPRRGRLCLNGWKNMHLHTFSLLQTSGQESVVDRPRSRS